MMGLIFAIFRKAGELDIDAIFSNIPDTLSSVPSDFSNKISGSDFGIGSHKFYTSPHAKCEELPGQNEIGPLCIVTDSRIDYRVGLAVQLGIDEDELNAVSDSKLILLSFIKWGSGCLNYLYGDFAFIIWNKESNELFCARDHFGCRPLFYVDDPNFFAVSSDVKVFQVLPGFKLQLDEKNIVDTICSLYPPRSESGFKNVTRIEPAHYVIASVENPKRSCRYWDLQVKDQYLGLSEDEAISGLRKRFLEAIEQRVISDDPIGVEMSGGLDSAGILYSLVKGIETKKEICTFSHAKGELNENDFGVAPGAASIKDLLELLGITDGFFITGDGDPGGYSAITNSLLELYKPVIQGYAVMSDLLYKKAGEKGVKVLLSGFGGDEGVSSFGSGILEEMVKKREIRSIHELLTKHDKNPRMSYSRLIIKYHILLFAPWLMRLKKRDRRNSLIGSFALDTGLFDGYDVKRRFKEQVFFPDFPDLRERQRFRLNHSYVLDRLESSSFNARQWGIEYRYPFLDVKLVEFYYSLRSVYKYKYRTGRYAFRQAMEGILDERVRMRQDKSDVPIPNIFIRLLKDRDDFVELIKDGKRNNKVHYVDYNKLLKMIDQFGNGNIKNRHIGPRAFISAVSVLILQKWQREGTIDIGIGC